MNASNSASPHLEPDDVSLLSIRYFMLIFKGMLYPFDCCYMADEVLVSTRGAFKSYPDINDLDWILALNL